MAFVETDYKYHNLRTEYREDGVYYRTQMSVHNSAEAATVINPGALATWAPTTAYVLSWQRAPWNQDGFYEIIAKDVDRVVREITDRGALYKKSFYVLDGDRETFYADNDIGADASSWTSADSYVFQMSERRLGGNWLVSLTAVDVNYYTGVRAVMSAS